LFIIKFTLASWTPASAASVRCTKDWHAAQVIPVTGIVTRSGEVDDNVPARPSVSSIFASGTIVTASLLLNARGEANAIYRGSDVIGTCLIGIEGHSRGADLYLARLHSLDPLKRSGHSPDTAITMHSFNRQAEFVSHGISPPR